MPDETGHAPTGGPMDFAGWVKRLRAHAEMTQREFGDAVGADAITVSRWERGVVRPEKFRAREVARLAKLTHFPEPMPE